MSTDLMRAIRAELTYDELDKLLRETEGAAFEANGSHYYPDLFTEVCMMKMRNEIGDGYFSAWLVLLCALLSEEERHEDLGLLFDGASFDSRYDARRCRELISFIREHDLAFRHPDIVDYHRQRKMKVIYLRFEFCAPENACINKCYIVDHGKKTFDLRMIDESELDFDLSKNYCRIYDEEHLEEIKQQRMDKTIECIDHTKSEKQFCEIEERLITLFYEQYRRDTSLSL